MQTLKPLLGLSLFCLLANTSPAQVLVKTQTGVAAGDELGVAVSGLDDVDADGYDDYIVSCLSCNGNQGRVFVYSGKTGAVIHTLSDPSENFGRSVASTQDMDGDGIREVLVSAPLSTCCSGGSTKGRIIVFSGKTGIRYHDILGESTMHLGYALAGLDDINGDGRGEILAGAPNYALDSGKVRIYSGAPGAPILADINGPWNACGCVDNETELGTSVAAVGDVNADGVPDFAAGGPEWSPTSAANDQRRGLVYVYSGATKQLLFQILGSVAWQRLGYSVAGAGDINGDGRDDVAVGIPYWDANETAATKLTGQGRVQIFSGVNGTLLRTINGDWDGQFFASSLANLGDIDGDGFDDLGVGMSGIGWFRAHSGKDGATLFTFYGNGQPGDKFGFSVAGAGDVNGDARLDVIVGSPQFDNGATNAVGNAKVFTLFPEGVSNFGTGTSAPATPGGCLGENAVTATGSPRVGQSFQLACHNAPVRNQFFWMFASHPSRSPNYFPMGNGILFHLDLAGAFWTIASFPSVATCDGRVLFTIPIPDMPELGGQTIYTQGLPYWDYTGVSISCPLGVAAPNCPAVGALKLSSTKGMSFTILP